MAYSTNTTLLEPSTLLLQRLLQSQLLRFHASPVLPSIGPPSMSSLPDLSSLRICEGEGEGEGEAATPASAAGPSRPSAAAAAAETVTVMPTPTPTPTDGPSGGRAAWRASQHVKRESRHLFHRLRSIHQDSKFVEQVARLYPHLPLTANLRCGAWYTPPWHTTLVSYFKSTDGHTHQWSFSLKRPNLHLLPSIQSAGGCVIVDSTTRGKSMPDALSKTVPIWCAVLNAASLARHGAAAGWSADNPHASLTTHPGMVGASERDQIRARVEAWSRALLESDLEVPRLVKPLRPVFVTRQTMLPIPELDTGKDADYTPIVLVSASEYVADSAALILPSRSVSQADHVEPADPAEAERDDTNLYVQGAGDDHENWARRLTPTLFWRHASTLLSASKAILPSLVDDLVCREGGQEWFEPQRPLPGSSAAAAAAWVKPDGKPVQVGQTGIWLAVAPTRQPVDAEADKRYATVVYCSTPPPSPDETESTPPSKPAHPTRTTLYLSMPSGKRGSTHLAVHLARLLPAAVASLEARSPILLRGTSYDHVSALAVLLLCLLFDASRRPLLSEPERQAHADNIDKQSTRKRLQWILADVPNAAPSRTYLLRVNDVLMGQRFRNKAAAP
ncbi:tRNA A64-2'-O-ribosylphosphate transferase [Thecaphora frezii]